MRASAIQMNSVNDKAANLAQAEHLALAAIKTDRPDLISFPENMSWCGGSVADRLAAAEQIEDGPTYALCRRLAKDHGLWVHAGTIPERAPDETRNRNTTVVFGPDGEIAARYSKIHMFDITTPDGQVYCESDVNEPGQEIVAFDLLGFRAGLTICYDMRFAELYAALARDGVNLLFVPAAFTFQTGRDHWHTLLASRAIETQSWLIAAAQWGTFPSPDGLRQMYGRSLIVDPWGTIVAQAPDGITHVTARIDRTRIEDVRARMPTIRHRRDWIG